MDLLESRYYGNSVAQWLTALAVGLLVFGVQVLLRRVLARQVSRLSGRTRSEVDDVLVDAIAATRWWFQAAIAIAVATLPLALPEVFRDRLQKVVTLITLVQIGIWGVVSIRAYVASYTERKVADDPASVTTIRALGFLATALVWVAVFLVALDNLGVRVTAMIAGLGIGGVAIALAVQNILGDLFASLSIVLDKPFVYGDFISVGDISGTVEKVGLKTTRLRSISGEQIIVSNSDLLQSRVRNFRRMMERRVVFTLGVVYRTTKDQLEAIPGMIRETIEALPDLRFDRAHFKAFGPSSLDVEVVYYVLTPDFSLYMDRQQAINLGILERFTAAGIDFAFPTNTVLIEGGSIELHRQALGDRA